MRILFMIKKKVFGEIAHNDEGTWNFFFRQSLYKKCVQQLHINNLSSCFLLKILLNQMNSQSNEEGNDHDVIHDTEER